MDPYFNMTLKGDIGEVADVLDRLEEFCPTAQVPPEKGTKLGIVLDELITNIIMHGLKDQPQPEITLLIQRSGNRLIAELADNGSRFNPLDAKVSLPSGNIEEMRVGGIGLAMVRSFVDKLNYVFEGGRNKISIEISVS